MGQLNPIFEMQSLFGPWKHALHFPHKKGFVVKKFAVLWHSTNEVKKHLIISGWNAMPLELSMLYC